jgi:hypothetical protein
MTKNTLVSQPSMLVLYLPWCTFCPNFAYHFKVANNWPTQPDPLLDLAKLHTVSLQAQEYDPVVINLHIEHHPDRALRTRDQLLTEAYRLSSPCSLQLEPGQTPTHHGISHQVPRCKMLRRTRRVPTTTHHNNFLLRYHGASKSYVQVTLNSIDSYTLVCLLYLLTLPTSHSTSH